MPAEDRITQICRHAAKGGLFLTQSRLTWIKVGDAKIGGSLASPSIFPRRRGSAPTAGPNEKHLFINEPSMFRKGDDHARCTNRRADRLRGHLGRRTSRLGNGPNSARPSYNRRDQKRCLGLDGCCRYRFRPSVGPVDLKRQYIFIARNGQVTALSANILRLDQMLRLYGPEADPAREALRKYAEHKTADLFPESPEAAARIDNQSTYEILQRVETLLLGLHASDQRQQWVVTQALTLASNIGNTRWLLVQENGDRTPKAFLGLVVFWLTLLFASFGLFAPRNWTAAVALMLCALAVSGAVEMIIELEQPFGGLIQISPQNALCRGHPRRAKHARKLRLRQPA